MELNFPECRKCNDGVLLPLSDYGRDGAPLRITWFMASLNRGEYASGVSGDCA